MRNMHRYLNIRLYHTIRQINHGLRESKDIIKIYSGITSGRALNRELLYTEILEVDLFASAYRLFHEDLERNLHETVCRQMQINQLLESLWRKQR